MLPRCSTSNSSTSAFSIFFPLQSSSSSASMDHFADQGGSCYYYSSSSSPSPASVDCTLSLGTPSTRQTSGTAANASVTHCRSSPCGKPASCCWDIINDATNAAAGQCSKPPQQASAPTGNVIRGDPLLLARRCANCDTTSTPLWRNGPRGPKSLCNACGIRYKKEERRAAASTASPTVLSTTSSTESVNYAAATNYTAWSCHPAAPTAPATKNSPSPWCGPSDESNVDHAPNYFSWRLNVVPPSQFPVTDNRPSLFQYQ